MLGKTTADSTGLLLAKVNRQVLLLAIELLEVLPLSLAHDCKNAGDGATY